MTISLPAAAPEFRIADLMGRTLVLVQLTTP